MILKALRVERFGCLNPGAFVERFNPNLTVVHGPNGAGKSTLFRALTYALYQRHGVTAQEAIAQIVPRGKDLGPRVEVTFEIDGVTWRLTKQFVRKAEIELARFDRGIFVPEVQGPAAEDRLRELLGSEKNLKGLAGAQYRGIGEILLVDQGSLRMADVSPLARDRLRLVIDRVGTTEGAHELLAAIEKRYSEIFGKAGEVRDKSALSRTQQEILDLQARKAELEAERVRAEQLSSELRALDSESPAQAAEELAQLEKDLEVARSLQIQVAQKRIEKQSLTEKLSSSTREADRLKTALGELLAARAEQERLAQSYALAERRWREQDDESRGAAQAFRDAETDVSRHVRFERELSERERALDDAKRGGTLARSIPDLEERVRGYAESTGRLGEIEQALAARTRPSPSEMSRIREQIQTLREKQRDGERLDVRVRITAEAATRVEVGPERVDLGALESRAVVTGDSLEIRVPGIVRIEVEAPGGIERARLSREIEAARAAVHELGLVHGTEDLSKLEDLAQERARLEGELQRHAGSRDALFKSERKAKDAVAELAGSKITLAELVERHPEWNGTPPDAASLVPVEQTLSFERKHFAEAQRAREALLESRRDNAARALAAMTTEEENLRSLKLDLARCEATIGQLEGAERDDQGRQDRLREADERRAACEQALADCSAELDTLGDPDIRIARISQDKRALEGACRRAEEERVRLTERLDQIRARGIWEDLGDVTIAIEVASERFERDRIAADALKLLRDVLVREQEMAVETAVRPVADRVARMARFMFGAGAKPNFGEALAPRALTADGPELPVDLLSAGTQDQLALMARLALGELYAEKCGRHAFVLDDPLVNCDRERRGKILELFAASRTLQIVIFTCSPELYRGLPEEKTTFIALEDAKTAAQALRLVTNHSGLTA